MKVKVSKETLIEMAEWRRHDLVRTDEYLVLQARKEALEAELQEVNRLISEYTADVDENIQRYKELPE